jgi:flagellar basal-body rod protein FlgB
MAALIDQLTNAGAMPALDATMRFAAGRQRLIAHNIANIDTPEFVQRDVSVDGFRRVLDEAVRERRERTGGMHGRLAMRETGELAQEPDGRLRLRPQTPSGGVLFHDRNNRDLERLMQALTETTAAFRTASDLYMSQKRIIDSAISERV